MEVHPAEEATNTEAEPQKRNTKCYLALLITAIVVVILVIVAVVVILVIKKNSNSEPEDNGLISRVTAICYGTTVHLSWTKSTAPKYETILVTVDGEEIAQLDTSASFFSLSGIEFVGSVLSLHLLTGSNSTIELINVTATRTELPTLIINTLDSAPIEDKETKVPTNIDLIDDNTPSYTLHVTDYSTTIKGRGNVSWDYPKKGYNLAFSKKQSLLGMKKHKKWSLVANYRDKTLLRNSFAHKLGRDVFNTVWCSTEKSVNVIINGDYLGTYILIESVRIDSNRVDIPDISKLEEDPETGLVNLDQGGFIMEIDFRLDAEYCFNSTKDVPFCLKRPDEVSSTIQEYVHAKIQYIEDVIYSDSYMDAGTGYPSLLDVPSFIDWYLVNEFVKNLDAAFQTSDFLYYNPSNAKVFMGPLWDFDGSMGCVDTLGVDDPIGFWVDKPHPSRTTNWYTRLLTDPSFVSQMKERWEEKKEEVHTLINSWIQSTANQLSVAADVNFVRWPILGLNAVADPAGYEQRTTYQSEVDFLISWLNTRYSWFDDAIRSL